MQLQGSQMEADDPTTSYMLQVTICLSDIEFFMLELCTVCLTDTKQNIFVAFEITSVAYLSGMGKAVQVPRTGLPSLYECCHASTTTFCST